MQILPQDFKNMRKIKNRTFTNFKSHLERFPNSKTMKFLDIPVKKELTEFPQNSDFAESIISNLGNPLKHIEIMSYCLQKSKDSFNFLRKSREIMETSGCRLEKKGSNDSSKIRNLLNKMVNPDSKMVSKETFKHQSKKSIFSNMKKEGLNASANILIQPNIANQVKSNNCTLKHIASKNVSSIFEQISKNKNTKLILESLQVSANSNNLLNDDFKFQNPQLIQEQGSNDLEFTIRDSPVRNIHTFRKRSTKKESFHGRIQSNEESKLKTLFCKKKEETFEIKSPLFNKQSGDFFFDLSNNKTPLNMRSFNIMAEDVAQVKVSSRKVILPDQMTYSDSEESQSLSVKSKDSGSSRGSSPHNDYKDKIKLVQSSHNIQNSMELSYLTNSAVSKESLNNNDLMNVPRQGWFKKKKNTSLNKNQKFKRIPPIKKRPLRILKRLKIPKSLNSGNNSSLHKQENSPKSSLAKKLRQNSKNKYNLKRKLSRLSKINSNITNNPERKRINSLKSSKNKKLNFIKIKDSFDHVKKIKSSFKNNLKGSFKEIDSKKGSSMFENSLGYCKDLFGKNGKNKKEKKFKSKPQQMKKKVRSIYKRKFFNSDVNKSKNKVLYNNFEPNVFQEKKCSKSRQKTRHCSKEDNNFSSDQGMAELGYHRNPLSPSSSINIKNVNINFNLNLNFNNNCEEKHWKTNYQSNKRPPKKSSFQNIVQNKILKATLEQKDLIGKLHKSRNNKNMAFFNKNLKQSTKYKYFKNITLV
jgi:hypothetical protein